MIIIAVGSNNNINDDCYKNKTYETNDINCKNSQNRTSNNNICSIRNYYHDSSIMVIITVAIAILVRKCYNK